MFKARSLVLAMTLACGPASAGQPLVLAFSELEPWKTTTAGEYGGAYTEIVRELAHRVGAPLTIVGCPLKRCLVMLEHGEADLFIGLKSSAQRREYLYFLRTPYRLRGSDKVFYVRKGQAAMLRKYDDLQKLRIGVKNGAENFARFSADESLNKIEAKDLATNFKKLVLGRLDAVIASEDQGEAVLSQLQLRGSVEKAPFRTPDSSGPRSIALSKKSAHMAHVEDIEAAMAAMVKDDSLAKLYKRYYFDAYRIPANSVPGL
jgi:polar amino acid transport system substrate-binding protein